MWRCQVGVGAIPTRRINGCCVSLVTPWGTPAAAHTVHPAEASRVSFPTTNCPLPSRTK